MTHVNIWECPPGVVTQVAMPDWKEVTSFAVQVCSITVLSDFHERVEEDTASIISTFADDTKISRVTATPAQIQGLQGDINKLQQWADIWQMSFNAGKCPVMHLCHNNPHHQYTMGSHHLNVTTALKKTDLGVWIQDNLKVSKQVAELAAKKANRVLTKISSSKTRIPPSDSTNPLSDHI